MPSTASEAKQEAYLGDGLYAYTDAATDTLWLRAPRFNTNHIVALEPKVLAEFVKYACRVGYRQTVERALAELTP